MHDIIGQFGFEFYLCIDFFFCSADVDPLVPYRLQQGDIITMGSTELRVQITTTDDQENEDDDDENDENDAQASV